MGNKKVDFKKLIETIHENQKKLGVSDYDIPYRYKIRAYNTGLYNNEDSVEIELTAMNEKDAINKARHVVFKANYKIISVSEC